MKDNVNKIIQEAKDRGYVPEKKEIIESDIYEAMRHLPHIGETKTVNKIYEVISQAIDSYNLEKIIELVYEGVVEILKEEEAVANKILKNSPNNFSAMGAIACIGDIKNKLLTNLTPNKEE